MPWARAWERIDADFEGHLEEIRRFLRRPTVSASDDDMLAGAEDPERSGIVEHRLSWRIPQADESLQHPRTGFGPAFGETVPLRNEMLL